MQSLLSRPLSQASLCSLAKIDLTERYIRNSSSFLHRPPSSERSESETKDAESLCQTKTARHDDPLLEEMEEESNLGATGDEASNSTKKHVESSTASEKSESETKDAESLCQTKTACHDDPLLEEMEE